MLNQLLARDVAAALHYVDVFVSGPNFESLEELTRAIAGAAREKEGDKR